MRIWTGVGLFVAFALWTLIGFYMPKLGKNFGQPFAAVAGFFSGIGLVGVIATLISQRASRDSQTQALNLSALTSRWATVGKLAGNVYDRLIKECDARTIESFQKHSEESFYKPPIDEILKSVHGTSLERVMVGTSKGEVPRSLSDSPRDAHYRIQAYVAQASQLMQLTIQWLEIDDRIAEILKSQKLYLLRVPPLDTLTIRQARDLMLDILGYDIFSEPAKIKSGNSK